MTDVRVAYAGDRDIAVHVLEFMLGEGVRPLALLTTDGPSSSHAAELTQLCDFLPDTRRFRGKDAVSQHAADILRALDLDYIIGVHFPLLVPPTLLEASRHGFLNLHPAYLPFNRGWHTATWAILDGTPVGATLHFMSAAIDMGDIVHRKRLDITPADTAHSLYARIKTLELEVFREAWPRLASGDYCREPQNPSEGTSHRMRDVYKPEVQRIDLDTPVAPRRILDQLRALTTSRLDEAAYFERDGRRYRVQVTITPDDVETR